MKQWQDIFDEELPGATAPLNPAQWERLEAALPQQKPAKRRNIFWLTFILSTALAIVYFSQAPAAETKPGAENQPQKLSEPKTSISASSQNPTKTSTETLSRNTPSVAQNNVSKIHLNTSNHNSREQIDGIDLENASPHFVQSEPRVQAPSALTDQRPRTNTSDTVFEILSEDQDRKSNKETIADLNGNLNENPTTCIFRCN